MMAAAEKNSAAANLQRLGSRIRKQRTLTEAAIAEVSSKPDHVTWSDIEGFWGALRTRDVLAVYQHALHKGDWVAEKRDELGSICRSRVGAIQGRVAKDVAILWAVKP